MNVRVRMFAVARELTGQDVVDVELPEGGTVADLRRALAARAPALTRVLGGVLFAVGSEYAADATVVPEGAEVACIPPVSGG